MRGRIFKRTASKTLCASATSRISGYALIRSYEDNEKAQAHTKGGMGNIWSRRDHLDLLYDLAVECDSGPGLLMSRIELYRLSGDP
jgi:hypothetical protein